MQRAAVHRGRLIQTGGGLPFHRGRLVQHGQGLGSILSKLFRVLVPVVKKTASAGLNLGKQALKNKVVKKAIGEMGKVGISAASDLIAGKPSSETKGNIAINVAKGRKRVAKRIRKSYGDPTMNVPPLKKRKITNNKNKSIYDY